MEKANPKKAILFDLDGTLLAQDAEEYFDKYFKSIARYVASPEESKAIIDNIIYSVDKMIRDDNPSETNCEKFRRYFTSRGGFQDPAIFDRFDDFYENEFNKLSITAKPKEQVKEVIKTIKSKGYAAILATMPCYPKSAIMHRVKWAGLLPSDFIHITHYENSRFSKPKKEYYFEIMEKTGFRPHECYMVGNNVQEDMCAGEWGFDLFWLNEYAVNNSDTEPECPKGGYDELLNWALALPRANE